MRHSINIALGLAFLAGCSSSSSQSTTDGGPGGTMDSGGTPADGGTTPDTSTAPDSGTTPDSATPDSTTPPDSAAPGDTGMMMTDTGGMTTDTGAMMTDTGTPMEAGTVGFRAIPLLGNGDRVTGIYCVDAHTCVVTGDPFGEAGHVYSSDGMTITGTLVTGDTNYAAMLGTIGTVSFLGVSLVGGKVVARSIDAEQAFVTATSNVTMAASWSGVVGANNTTDFGINTQFGIGTDGTHWTLMTAGRIWEATSAPSPATLWTNVFSPQAVPPIPADIATQVAADPTLCDTDPSVSISPDLTQAVYIAADDSLIVTPAGAVNQSGDDTAGVCISLDRGHTFHHAAFANVAMGSGPVGVTCTSKDHCVAYGGIQSTPNSAYVYVSTNASMGAASTWTAATTPALPMDTQLRSAAFAPDGVTGWLVGSNAANGSLMFTTTDGGKTWVDASTMIANLAQNNRLHAVYAFDATHVWIGGENDTLITSGN